MPENLRNFTLDDPIFADANVFVYHHTSHPRYGDDCSDFLTRWKPGDA